ncbi:MAG: hypothetical protein U9R47_05360, partial [Actinomycetota bacterium]|nr:hypothetical protein [Actinomycetota bacterium]
TAPSEHEIDLQKRIEEMQSVIGAMESEIRTRPTTSETTKLEHRQVEESVGAPPVEAKTVLIEPEAADDDAGHGEPPQSVAASEIEEHIEIVVTDTAPIAPADTPASTIETAEVDDADTGLDPEPSADHSSITDDRTADAVRRSFYSRRSAKLPRIGEEAGRDALAAVAGLRTNLTPDATKDNSDPDRSQEFETVS